MYDPENVAPGLTASILLVDGGSLTGAHKLHDGRWDWRGVLIEQSEVKAYLPHAATIVDNTAVEALAFHMRRKLTAARLKGRGGWQDCEPQVLSDMLHEHVTKGDPVDVANFCAFLSTLGSPILPRSQGHATEPTPA